MRAVITVVGKDVVGILAKVSGLCAESGVNIVEVSQTVLQDLFCMIMLVQLTDKAHSFAGISDQLAQLGEQNGLAIHMMHEDVFNAMHRV